MAPGQITEVYSAYSVLLVMLTEVITHHSKKKKQNQRLKNFETLTNTTQTYILILLNCWPKFQCKRIFLLDVRTIMGLTIHTTMNLKRMYIHKCLFLHFYESIILNTFRVYSR